MADEDTPEDGNEFDDADFYLAFSTSQFWTGFQWALKVVKASQDFDEAKLDKLIREVAAGESSLEPTPEEAIRDYQAKGLNDEEITDELRRVHSGEFRRRLDAEQRSLALDYVRAGNFGKKQ